MPDREHTLARPHVRIGYADTGGNGRAVVFLHGAGLDRTIFDPQAGALAGAGRRAVTWDLPGHGASEPDDDWHFTAQDALADLEALLDHLGLDSPVLVGHSLGGNLAQAFVRAHPERIGGLIVIDSTWNTGPLSVMERVGLRLGAPLLALIPGSRLPGLMARASAATPGAIARAESIFARMPKPSFLEVWRATTTLVSPDPGYRTPVPLGLIKGEKDATGNIAIAMTRWARADGVSEQIIPGAAHIPTLDAPDAVSDAILSTLARWWPDDPGHPRPAPGTTDT